MKALRFQIVSLLFGLAYSNGDTDPGGQDEVEQARTAAVEWLLAARDYEDISWGNNTHRAAVALAFLQPTYFCPQDCRPPSRCDANPIITSKEVLLRLFTDLFNNQSQFTVFHTNALMATCQLDTALRDGVDVVGILEAIKIWRSQFSLAFNQLALCNAGGDISQQNYEALLRILEADNGPEPFQDTKAYATLTLICLLRRDMQLYDTEELLVKNVEYFQNLRQEDGSYGGLITTSLSTQVLLAAHSLSEDDFITTLDWVLERQDPDGSFMDPTHVLPRSSPKAMKIIGTYMVAPILSRMSLTDLSSLCLQCSY